MPFFIEGRNTPPRKNRETREEKIKRGEKKERRDRGYIILL